MPGWMRRGGAERTWCQEIDGRRLRKHGLCVTAPGNERGGRDGLGVRRLTGGGSEGAVSA